MEKEEKEEKMSTLEFLIADRDRWRGIFGKVTRKQVWRQQKVQLVPPT